MAERTVHHQLATELAPRDGLRGLVLSASKELEPGTRAMLLLAEGLFRLDVAVSADSLRAIVRNLSSGIVEMEGGQGRAAAAVTSFGEVASNHPGRARMGFTIGPAGDRLMVKVTLGTLWFSERGTVRVSAQAIARQAAPE